MIQDRLTAKFRAAFVKAAAKRVAKDKRPTKRIVAPVADIYTKGRQLSGSFWV